MARKKNKSILDILVLLPWWISAILSIVSYLILKYWITSLVFQQTGPTDITYMFYKGLANALPLFAPIAALFFLLIAAISAINSWRKRQTPCLIPLSQTWNSQLNQPARKSYSIIDKSDTGKITSYSQIDDTDSQISDMAAIKSHCANHSHGYAIESERVKEKVDLSIETLKKIEWFSFELFCKIYYECIGYKVTKTKSGADGGVDLLLYMSDSVVPCALVQCKSRAHRDIGVHYIRELLGVMTSQNVNKGILITNSGFTKEALEFANANKIESVHLYKLWTMLDKLDADKKTRLIDFLKSTDFTTPTCPNCEVKLVERIAKKGKNIGQRFWGCINYPRCSYSLQMNNTNNGKLVLRDGI